MTSFFITFMAYTDPVSFLRTWNTLPNAPCPTRQSISKSSGVSLFLGAVGLFGSVRAVLSSSPESILRSEPPAWSDVRLDVSSDLVSADAGAWDPAGGAGLVFGARDGESPGASPPPAIFAHTSDALCAPPGFSEDVGASKPLVVRTTSVSRVGVLGGFPAAAWSFVAVVCAPVALTSLLGPSSERLACDPSGCRASFSPAASSPAFVGVSPLWKSSSKFMSSPPSLDSSGSTTSYLVLTFCIFIRASERYLALTSSRTSSSPPLRSTRTAQTPGTTRHSLRMSCLQAVAAVRTTVWAPCPCPCPSHFPAYICCAAAQPRKVDLESDSSDNIHSTVSSHKKRCWWRYLRLRLLFFLFRIWC